MPYGAQDLDECKDLITSLYVEQHLSISEIAEELRQRGYEVAPSALANYIKDATRKVAEYERNEIDKETKG